MSEENEILEDDFQKSCEELKKHWKLLEEEVLKMLQEEE